MYPPGRLVLRDKQTMYRVCLPVRGAFSPSENLPLRTKKELPFIRVTIRGVSEAL